MNAADPSAMMSERNRAILLSIFSDHAARIERVDVYGSRARGTHRPGSDIDLIVAGDLGLEEVLSIAVALDESYLSIFADLQCYSRDLTPAFAAEVARDARVLFRREELLAYAGPAARNAVDDELGYER